jgi:mannose-6-phosphate isomerase-like protein (cupin superfamily)
VGIVCRLDAGGCAGSSVARRLAAVGEATVTAPGGGEVVGDTPQRRVEILAEHEALHATCGRLGPRGDGADLHVHRHHSDVFYVLSGVLTLRIGSGGEPVAAPAGALARVPPLVVHGFRNETDDDVRYINLHAPGVGFATYLRGLRDGRTVEYDQEPPPADGGRPPSEAAVGATPAVADTPGLRLTLLADAEEVAVAEARAGAGAGALAAAHVHHRHAEWLYVIDGEMAVRTGEREQRAPAGSWVEVPAGVPHALASAGPRPARLLDVHAPGCNFGAYVRAIAGGETDPDAAAAQAGFDREWAE